MNAILAIRNPSNNRQTVYTLGELRREAQRLVKQFKVGKYSSHHVEIVEGSTPRLVVQVKRADGLIQPIYSVL